MRVLCGLCSTHSSEVRFTKDALQHGGEGCVFATAEATDLSRLQAQALWEPADLSGWLLKHGEINARPPAAVVLVLRVWPACVQTEDAGPFPT